MGSRMDESIFMLHESGTLRFGVLRPTTSKLNREPWTVLSSSRSSSPRFGTKRIVHPVTGEAYWVYPCKASGKGLHVTVEVLSELTVQGASDRMVYDSDSDSDDDEACGTQSHDLLRQASMQTLPVMQQKLTLLDRVYALLCCMCMYLLEPTRVKESASAPQSCHRPWGNGVRQAASLQ